jgi:UDP-N-acetylmuramoyl-L-alanyl-D-glutamate--2,6-diaminopimelate ligase
MKFLKDIIKDIKVIKTINEKEGISINGIAFDSRKIEKGFIFVAEKGAETDGHLFIDKAISNGAIVVVCQDEPKDKKDDVTYLIVEDSTYCLGIISRNFFDNPTSKLKLVGITGTNGKTTTVTLLYRLFTSLGYPCGLLSTVENKVLDKTYPTERTTMDSISMNVLMKEMVEKGCEYCFMEVSSHAIVQNRIAGLTFFGAIFSNITLDHLDYHKTFANYIKAKKKFFDDLPKTAFSLTNLDDKNGEVMLQNTKAKKYTYSLKTMADFRAVIIDDSFDGLHLKIDNEEVFCNLIGQFNAYNLLAIYSAAILCGLKKEEVLVHLSSLNSASGRFESYHLKNGSVAIIDYAHTPDALENVLKTINDIRPKKKNNEEMPKIITVVGCGGDRDRSKRPIMASIAEKLSDIVVLTSDNPRTEDPNMILEEMKKGIKDNDRNVFTIVDRREGIKLGCTLAKKGDIVLIAGKGHETYQEINHVKHHFDDKEEIMKY